MRILWIHQYFATPKGWGAVRTYEFARRFCSGGHAVDVVCCAGYDASLIKADVRPVVLDGMRIYVSGTAYRPHMGFLRRILSFLQFMVCALWHVLGKGKEYDLVIASSGPLTLAVPALVGRWLWRLPFVFEVIDVWPDSAIAAGVLKNPVLKWLSFKVEALAYKYASAVVTCSTGMTERVGKKLRRSFVHYCDRSLVGKPEGGGRRTEDGGRSAEVRECESSKVVTISNCCDLEQFAPDIERRQKTRARFNVRDDQTVVLYTGAMGLSNAVEDLVEAVKETAGDERIVWWFAGSGPRSALLRYCVSSLVGRGGVLKFESSKVREWEEKIGNQQSAVGNRASLRNRFFGTLAKDQVLELYLAADVNVVTFMREPLFVENSPNKFFDGIAAGLPAIFNRTTWLEPWLERYGCGIVCKSDAPGQKMADAIRGLAGDRERLRKMGRGARLLAEEVFSRDKLATEYLEVLEEVLKCESAGVLK